MASRKVKKPVKSEVVKKVTAVPVTKIDISKETVAIAKLEKKAIVIAVSDKATQNIAVETLSEVGKLQKKLKEKKEPFLVAKRALESAISGHFGPPEQALRKLELMLKDELQSYQRFLIEENDRQKAKLEKAIEAGKIKPEVAERKKEELEAAAPSNTIKTEGGEVTFRKERDVVPSEDGTFVLMYEDSKKTVPIPDEFWQFNMPALRKAILKDGKHVPGFEVKEDLGSSKS